MSNKNEEIAVEIKNKVWSWTPSTMIEKQWKIISTSYKIEYTLGAVQNFQGCFFQMATKSLPLIVVYWSSAKQTR